MSDNAQVDQKQEIDYARLAAEMKAQEAAKVAPAHGSVYQQVLQKHLADSSNDPSAVKAIDELLNAKAQEVVQTNVQATNFANAITLLNDEIERVVENDDEAGKYAKAVELLVKAEFDGSTAEGNARLQKVAAGLFTKQEMRDLTKKHFSALKGEEKKQQNGVTGMQSDASATAVAAAAQIQNGSGGSFKDLNEPQREMYYAICAEYNRNDNYNAKGEKLSQEQVEADALARASRKFKKGLEG